MSDELWTPKPLNLTARAAYLVPGNPVVTRPEDAVANCYPGLELDIRNRDRRFFPGLVFEFVARGDTGDPYTEPTRYGARLAYVDNRVDPDISRELTPQIKQYATTLGAGDWYIEWMEQEGRRLSMLEDRGGHDGRALRLAPGAGSDARPGDALPAPTRHGGTRGDPARKSTPLHRSDDRRHQSGLSAR
jgi:hypothetical protein